MRAEPKGRRAKPTAIFRLQLTRRSHRALGKIGERVNEARGDAQSRRAQVKWHALALGQLRILKVEFNQRFDVIGYKGDRRDDDANGVLRGRLYGFLCGRAKPFERPDP
jgi:hypothetical protein